MSKHTPGPWRSLARSIEDRNSQRVARINWRGPESTAANARLIAAAPEMLSALRMTTKALIDLAPYSPDVAEGLIAIVGIAHDLLARIDGDKA